VKNFSILFPLVFLYAISAQAQIEKQIIYGKIVDAETSIQLEKADVLEKISGTGTSTDVNGNFSLTVKFPVKLSVSHIGYETQIINLNASPDNVLLIPLTKTSTELPVVSVFPGKAENIILNNELSIMDYEFMNENILLLAQSTRFSKPSLVLLNEKFDTITVTPLDVHPEFIFHDCMDNLHLVEKKFSFQLNFDGKNIQLLYPVTSEILKEKLLPCVEKLHDNFYFSEFTNKGLSLLYSFKDSAEKSNNMLSVISDRKKLNMLKNEAEFALAPGHKYEEWDKHFFDSMVVSKVYAPLVKLRDTMYVFNFVDGQIEQYSESGKPLTSVFISFHKQKNWKENILTDEVENKCYAVFGKNGIIQLKEVNIQTGEIESSADFSGFPFAENIKIRSGYVYFLYPDSARQGYVRLYRKRL